IDVDHFKLINDSMGHPAGDALLVDVARRLKRLMRPGDLVARLGGDEFAMVVTLDGREAPAFAGAVMDAFAPPFHLDGIEEHVACSLGIALAPEHGDDVNVLLRNADLA